MGITKITFWLDNNLDGFFQPGLDTQLGLTMNASCLNSTQGCVLTFGNIPIFGGLAGIFNNIDQEGVSAFAAFIVVATLGGQPIPGASLQVRDEAKASDITNNTVGGPFSSNFSPSFATQAANIRAVIEGVGPNPNSTSTILLSGNLRGANISGNTVIITSSRVRGTLMVTNTGMAPKTVFGLTLSPRR